MRKTWEEVELNKKKLSPEAFTRKDLPPNIQELVAKDCRIYVLKPGEWVAVGGYQVKLVKEAPNDNTPSMVVVKYPAVGDFYWLKVLFATFRRGAVWVYDSCRIPFSDMLVCRWEIGDGSKIRRYLATFRETHSGGPSTSG